MDPGIVIKMWRRGCQYSGIRARIKYGRNEKYSTLLKRIVIIYLKIPESLIEPLIL